ncbi:MAG TPA: hypothetical protein VKY31_13155 [Terriglobia bacterium]|nr:hypothetical protein [Terriglobia bacterium]
MFANDIGAVPEDRCRILEGPAVHQDLVDQSMAEAMRNRFLDATLTEYGFEGLSYDFRVVLAGSEAVPEKIFAVASGASRQRKAFERLLRFRVERQPDRITVFLRAEKDGVAHRAADLEVRLLEESHVRYPRRIVEHQSDDCPRSQAFVFTAPKAVAGLENPLHFFG